MEEKLSDGYCRFYFSFQTSFANPFSRRINDKTGIQIAELRLRKIET